jgi:ribosomal protein S18 acetylase RimI-like enzyme
MTSPQQLEVLDLRHFSAKQLRPLLEEEAAVWQHRLRWDYRSSTELLLQYLDSRILPGFVVLDRSRVCGFTFCVYEGHKAVIGDIYASQSEPSPHAIVKTLIRHLLETLQASPSVHRIEGQLLLYDSGFLPPLLASALAPGTRLLTHPRLFLGCDLTQPPPETGLPHPFIPPDLEIARWSPSFYQPTAELIQKAYVGHLDSDINDQYRTLAGSERFLHNIIRFPGCGAFDPESSFVFRTRRANRLVAVILCSRVAPDTGHITQLCIDPAYRGRRIGAALLRHNLRALHARRYRIMTLTCSENNLPALNLYHANGFQNIYRFDALVFDKFTLVPPRP